MNEFNYEGWIGSILDSYTSTSEFPAEGSLNTIYIVRDSGTATAYVWDDETSDYIELADSGGGGGGGGGGADVWEFGQIAVSGQAIDVMVLRNGEMYSGDINFSIAAYSPSSGAPVGSIMGTGTVTDGMLSISNNDYPDVSAIWGQIVNVSHYDFIFFTGTQQQPVMCGMATWYNVGFFKPYKPVPTIDGTYTLQLTVASGVPTYSWV